tara:strand:- start:1603 stop:1860 length:258 start_codon:yes stop_codon:yes gene_type:complete
MNTNELYEYYQNLLIEAQTSVAGKVMTSSNKRGWNKTFGVPVPSIRDHISDYNARVRAINDMCVEATGKSLIYEEEVKPIKLIKQ